MRCKACNRIIDVKWRTSEIGPLLEDLCAKCLTLAFGGTWNEQPTEDGGLEGDGLVPCSGATDEDIPLQDWEE